MKNDKIFNQFGFSLIEVVIAMGIAGVVSLGVMKINENMIKGQRTMEQRSNKLDFHSKLVRLLADQNVCDATLWNTVIPTTVTTITTGVQIPAINTWVDPSVNPITARVPRILHSRTRGGVGNNIGGGSGNLYIKDLRVGNFVPTSAPFDTDNPATANVVFDEIQAIRGTATVAISFDKSEDNPAGALGQSNTTLSYGKALVTTIPIEVVVRADNNRLLSCYSDTNQHLAAMCANLGGTLDSADGICKQLNIFRLNPATNPAPSLGYSITAQDSFHAVNGVFIGAVDFTDTAGNSLGALGGYANGNHGLGVDVAIPGRGQIAAEKNITSMSGNIVANGQADPTGGPSVGGNVIAQANVTATNGNVRANTYIRANGIGLANTTVIGLGGAKASRHTIFTTNGDVVSRNGSVVAKNELWAGTQVNAFNAQFRNCAGGTVVANNAGQTSCRASNPASTCANSYNSSTRRTSINAFFGYDNNGNEICRTIMTFNSNACPDGEAMIGYESTNSSGNLTPVCVEPGEGCDDINIVNFNKWKPGVVPGSPGYFSTSSSTRKAIPENVCANGFNAPLDKNGFRCPGTIQNKELPDLQPLSYGCESSSESDTSKVTRYFTHWTCGEPTQYTSSDTASEVAGKNSLDQTGEARRECKLRGIETNRTYAECHAQNGLVAFYSSSETTVKDPASRSVGVGSNGQVLFHSSREPIILYTGKEEDSYCLLPQLDPLSTTGRSMSGIIDTCDSSCDDLRNKVFSVAKIQEVRSCYAGFKTSRDKEGYQYYHTSSVTDCEPQEKRSLATNAAGDKLCNAVNKSSSVSFYSKFYATKDPNPANWVGTRIGQVTGEYSIVDGSGNPLGIPRSGISDHASELPSTPFVSAWDTVTWDHASETGDYTKCEDNENNQFHYAEFACYAIVSGFGCE